MTVHSMTGYGSATVDIDTGDGVTHRYTVVLRAVNHRFLDIKLRLGRDMMALESIFTKRLKARLERGHVEGFIEADPGTASRSAVQVDEPLAVELHQKLDGLRQTLGVDAPIAVCDLTAFSDVVAVRRRRIDPSEHLDAFGVGVDQAIEALIAMRAVEGRSTAQDLSGRIAALRRMVVAVTARLPEVVAAHQERLEKRISALLTDPARLDSGRIEHEIAFLADKSDVSEELSRLSSHLDQFMAELDATPRGRGKMLEFLTQELLREVNTSGSKVGAADLTTEVIDAKCELEKVREQVANLE